MKESLDKIINEVTDRHPYKQSGNPDSYGQYNEGWSDACDILGQELSAYALGYVANLKAEIAQLRSKLDDCKRQKLTGSRI